MSTGNVLLRVAGLIAGVALTIAVVVAWHRRHPALIDDGHFGWVPTRP